MQKKRGCRCGSGFLLRFSFPKDRVLKALVLFRSHCSAGEGVCQKALQAHAISCQPPEIDIRLRVWQLLSLKGWRLLPEPGAAAGTTTSSACLDAGTAQKLSSRPPQRQVHTIPHLAVALRRWYAKSHRCPNRAKMAVDSFFGSSNMLDGKRMMHGTLEKIKQEGMSKRKLPK